ncbi:hypothetical protein Angca_000741, partial [Angiostrongylus cantonensis]
LVELLIVAHGELEMPRIDTSLLVVTSGITGQFQYLSGEVFEHGGQVDWSSTSDTTSIVAFAKHTMKSANGELQPGTGRSRLGFASGLRFASFSATRHLDNATILEHRRMAMLVHLTLLRKTLCVR